MYNTSCKASQPNLALLAWLGVGRGFGQVGQLQSRPDRFSMDQPDLVGSDILLVCCVCIDNHLMIVMMLSGEEEDDQRGLHQDEQVRKGASL